MERSVTDGMLLFNMQVSQWTGRKEDRLQTSYINTQHNAIDRAARVHKSLLPTCVELQKIHRITSKIRAYVNLKSLPWMNHGQRVVKAAAAVKMTAEIRKLRQEWDKAVKTFLDAYEHRVSEAAQSLGSLYDPDDYPPKEVIAGRFGITISFSPVPRAEDFRVELADKHVQQMARELAEHTEHQLRQSMQQALSRFGDAFRSLSEKLRDPNCKFRVSSLDKVVALCDEVSDINLLDDPDLDKVARRVSRVLNTYDAPTLRDDDFLRRKVGRSMRAATEEVDKILGVMGGFASA